jgi:IMP dehydrogenase
MDKFVGEGLTYDDVLLVPAYSEVLPRDVDIRSKFTRNIVLNVPSWPSPSPNREGSA